MILRRLKRKKPVCFLHIGKTGGTTLLGVFDKILNQAKICPARHMEEIERMSKKEIGKFHLYRGHFWYSIEEYLPNDTRFFTVLRDPVDRVVSTYDHIRTFPHARHDIVKEMSLEAFVDSPNQISIEIDNWQTRVISSCIDPEQTPSLSLAIERMDRFPLVGITECMKETISIMTEAFDWPSHSCFETKNVTESRTDRSKIGERVLKKIEIKNALDTKLYKLAKIRFEALRGRYL